MMIQYLVDCSAEQAICQSIGACAPTLDFGVEERVTAQADGYCIRTAVLCMLKYLLVHRNGEFNTWILKVCQLFGAGIIWHVVF